MRADTGDYISPAAQALLSVVSALGRKPLEPQTVASLCERTGSTRNQTFRALKNLETAGWADRLPGGWRLAPGIVRISERYRLAIADAHRQYLGGNRDE